MLAQACPLKGKARTRSGSVRVEEDDYLLVLAAPSPYFLSVGELSDSALPDALRDWPSKGETRSIIELVGAMPGMTSSFNFGKFSSVIRVKVEMQPSHLFGVLLEQRIIGYVLLISFSKLAEVKNAGFRNNQFNQSSRERVPYPLGWKDLGIPSKTGSISSLYYCSKLISLWRIGNIGFLDLVSTGQIPFEMDGVSLSNARQAATLAAHKL
ncbi:ribosomal protein L16 [Tanacetum coccineum]